MTYLVAIHWSAVILSCLGNIYSPSRAIYIHIRIYIYILGYTLVAVLSYTPVLHIAFCNYCRARESAVFEYCRARGIYIYIYIYIYTHTYIYLYFLLFHLSRYYILLFILHSSFAICCRV